MNTKIREVFEKYAGENLFGVKYLTVYYNTFEKMAVELISYEFMEKDARIAELKSALQHETDCLEAAKDKIKNLEGQLAQGGEQVVPDGWQPIETAPKDGRTLLLGGTNQAGNWRTRRGKWYSLEVIAEEWEDPDEAHEGWHETSVECEDLPNAWPTDPTHWMPLPNPPEPTK